MKTDSESNNHYVVTQVLQVDGSHRHHGNHDHV